MKEKVGLFLRNSNVSSIDLRNPEKGNPGVGGTQFSFVSLVFYLNQYQSEGVEPILYAQASNLLPRSVATAGAETPTEAVRGAANDGCEMFLMRVAEDDDEEEIFSEAASVGLPMAVWAHNYPGKDLLDNVSEYPIVKRVIFVGQEELDLYRDHPAFYKSRRIFNGIDPSTYAPSNHKVGKGTTVVYLGSLHKGKGFHRLARVWPRIRERVPDAQLIVIGSGALYDRDKTLGSWGVAAEEYEKEFRPHLSGPDGSPHSSVTFKGNMGSEKIPLLQQADVGVPNPTGTTETFCFGAVEFQASGTPVVSAAEGGLLDTVQDWKTGRLIQTDQELEDAIVLFLENRELRKECGENALRFAREKFNYEKICREWRKLFHNVSQGVSADPQPIQQNLFYRDKWIREGMRLAKKKIPSLRSVPPLCATSRRALVGSIMDALLVRG